MGAAESTEAQPPQEESGPVIAGNKASEEAPVQGPLPSALVICGPSGVGKGTLIKKLIDKSNQFGFSCSHTTRAPREGEKDGVEYWFTTKEQMLSAIKEGKFLEYAEVHGNIYGTSYQAVQNVALSGKSCILDIDVQGARLVRKSNLRALFVFIQPPSMEELEKRLRGRGTEAEEDVRKRLQAAQKELDSLEEPGLFDFVIRNDDLERAFLELREVAALALAGHVSPKSAAVPMSPPEEPSQPQVELEAEPSVATATPDEVDEEPVELETHGLARWRGKVALVTGASAGIGWSTCESLALAGLRVVGVARRRDRLEALQQSLLAQGVPIADFLPVVCDITKEAEVVALPRIIVKRWPDAGVDVLINNAGMARNNASLFEGSTASWVEMISTNVLGLCMCTREAIKDMKRRGKFGHIINISSLAGHRVPNGAGGISFYAATKHAVKALTEGLRQEARGHGVPLRVSSISPGMVETEFDVVQTFGNEEAARERYSKFKCLQPEDVSDAVLWVLASPDHMEVNDILIRPTEQTV